MQAFKGDHQLLELYLEVICHNVLRWASGGCIWVYLAHTVLNISEQYFSIDYDTQRFGALTRRQSIVEKTAFTEDT